MILYLLKLMLHLILVFCLKLKGFQTLVPFFRSFPKTCFGEDDPWLSGLQRGLRDILFSKISREQRDPALKLVSAVVEASRGAIRYTFRI